MVWYELRALAGALIGLIGFVALFALAAALAVHGDHTMLAGVAMLAPLWLVFWLVYFHITDGRKARATPIICELLAMCGTAIAVYAEFAKVVDDRNITRSAADQWSIVIGAVVLAVLATLAIRNLTRIGSSPRWFG